MRLARNQDSILTTNRAFTLLELVVVLFIVAVLAALLLPATANKGSGSQTRCINNLKQINLAMIMWINESGNTRFPWRLPLSQGGTHSEAGDKRGIIWKEFFILNRELPDPKVLVCPSDEAKKPNRAKNWGARRDGGLAHPDYQNKAISYFLNLDCGTQTDKSGVINNWELAQSHVIFGDRNLQVDQTNEKCSVGINNAAQVRVRTEHSSWGKTAWTNPIHGEKGNLAIADGSVVSTIQATIETLFSQSNDRGFAHLLFP